MTLDATISLGNIISAGAVIVTIIGAVVKITAKLAKVEWKLNLIWKWYAREHGIDESNGDS